MEQQKGKPCPFIIFVFRSSRRGYELLRAMRIYLPVLILEN